MAYCVGVVYHASTKMTSFKNRQNSLCWKCSKVTKFILEETQLYIKQEA